MATKIHALVEANHMSVALNLAAGQSHDGRDTTGMLATFEEGDIPIAKRAYNAGTWRMEMKARDA